MPAIDDAAAVPPKPQRRGVFAKLGPGLITGAADDDPSGIATYSQVGAKFGYSLGWTLLFSYPLMAAVQLIAAQVGRITGHGIADNMRRHFPLWVGKPIVFLVLAANTINIGANLSAMADCIVLFIPAPTWPFVFVFAVGSMLAQIFFKYADYARILKWLTLSLLFYLATFFMVDIDWGGLLDGTIRPTFSTQADYWSAIIAILGTTISPYLLFWQSAQEVEDIRDLDHRQPIKKAPHQARAAFKRIRLDTLVGMGASNLIAFAIITTAAATLHRNGIFQIDSSAQAAEALKPAAGALAQVIFAIGIIGTGLLSVPVLAGSAAYAMGEMFGWRTGLNRDWRKAKHFYAVIALSVGIGGALTILGINPITALYLSAIVNGIVAAPVLALLMLLARRRSVMGDWVARGPTYWLGWATVIVMTGAAIALFLTL